MCHSNTSGAVPIPQVGNPGDTNEASHTAPEQREAGMDKTNNNQHHGTTDGDQDEPEVWNDLRGGWDLVHHSGHPRLNGSDAETPRGCVL